GVRRQRYQAGLRAVFGSWQSNRVFSQVPLVEGECGDPVQTRPNSELSRLDASEPARIPQSTPVARPGLRCPLPAQRLSTAAPLRQSPTAKALDAAAPKWSFAA